MLIAGYFLLGKRSFSSPYAKKLFGGARVLAFGTIVAATFGVCSARTAVADVESAGLDLGRDLENMSDLIGSATALDLNNQEIFYGHAITSDPVDKVADRFEAYCNEDPALRGLDWDDVADTSINPTAKSNGLNLGTVRKTDENRGDTLVVCFRRPDGAEKKTWADALEEFNDTGDLAALGHLRYAHVGKSATSGKTAIQSVWTNGSFNINTLMPPEDGTDAPGSDSARLPRPAHAQRVLTATAKGVPYSARMYVTSQGIDEATADYVDQMDRAGWLALKHPFVADNPKLGLGRWFEKEGAQAMVSSTTNEEGKTVLIVGDLGDASKMPPRGDAQ